MGSSACKSPLEDKANLPAILGGTAGVLVVLGCIYFMVKDRQGIGGGLFDSVTPTSGGGKKW